MSASNLPCSLGGGGASKTGSAIIMGSYAGGSVDVSFLLIVNVSKPAVKDITSQKVPEQVKKPSVSEHKFQNRTDLEPCVGTLEASKQET